MRASWHLLWLALPVLAGMLLVALLVLPSPAAAGTAARTGNIPAGTAGWTQDNWRWCQKCQGMHYAVGGICPAGGAHDTSGSSPYVVIMT